MCYCLCVRFIYLRNWERNDNFFTKFKSQLAESGDPEYTELFLSLDNYIRWKGKEDSAKHLGKSMMRKFCISILEIYRYMWIIIMEIWAINEEKQQFNSFKNSQSTMMEEFLIFQKIKELYMSKIEKMEKFNERSIPIPELEEDLDKIAQKPGLMEKMKTEVLGKTKYYGT